MPTTTRLVAAILMAALGGVVATLAIPFLPEGQPAGQLQPVSALFGMVVGWFWTGPRVESRTGHPVGLGFAGAVLHLLAVVFAFALYEMLDRSTNLRYGGPVAAVQDMVAVGVGYLRTMAQLEVMGTLAVGGIVVGLVCGWTARRFR